MAVDINVLIFLRQVRCFDLLEGPACRDHRPGPREQNLSRPYLFPFAIIIQAGPWSTHVAQSLKGPDLGTASRKDDPAGTLPPFFAVVASHSKVPNPPPPHREPGAMELELEAGGGGRVVPLSSESPAADLGRGDQAPADLNVSRRHVSLRLVGGGEPRVAFDVVGRNPVLVRSSFGGDKVYRRGEAGELRAGDGLSLSLSAPSFWTVRRTGGEGEAGAGEEAEVDTAVLDAVARREKRTRERKERERERRAAEEATEVTKEEVMAASGDDELDEEVEDLKIDLESIDPVQGELGFGCSSFQRENAISVPGNLLVAMLQREIVMAFGSGYIGVDCITALPVF